MTKDESQLGKGSIGGSQKRWCIRFPNEGRENEEDTVREFQKHLAAKSVKIVITTQRGIVVLEGGILEEARKLKKVA